MLCSMGFEICDAPYDFVGPSASGRGDDQGGGGDIGGGGDSGCGGDSGGGGERYDKSDVLDHPLFCALRTLVGCSRFSDCAPTKYSQSLTLAMLRSRGNRGIVRLGPVGPDTVFLMQDFYESPDADNNRLSQADVVQLVLVKPINWGGESDIYCNCVLPLPLIQQIAQRSESKQHACVSLQIAAGGAAAFACPHIPAFISAVSRACSQASARKFALATRLVQLDAQPTLGYCIFSVVDGKIFEVAAYSGRFRCLSCRSTACEHTAAAATGQSAAAASGVACSPDHIDPKGLLREFPNVLHSRPLPPSVASFGYVAAARDLEHFMNSVVLQDKLSIVACRCLPPPAEQSCCGPVCNNFCFQCYAVGSVSALVSIAPIHLRKVLFRGSAVERLPGGRPIEAPQFHCAVCKKSFVPPLLGIAGSVGCIVSASRYNVAALILDLWVAERSVLQGAHFNHASVQTSSMAGYCASDGSQFGTISRQELMDCIYTMLQHTQAPNVIGRAAAECLICGPAPDLKTVQADGMNHGVPKYLFQLLREVREGRIKREVLYEFSRAVSINNPKLRKKLMEYWHATVTSTGASPALCQQLQALLAADNIVGSKLLFALQHCPAANLGWGAGSTISAIASASEAASTASGAGAELVIPPVVDEYTRKALQPYHPLSWSFQIGSTHASC